MIPDDGDIIRGLGFVTLYSALAEESVDNLLRCIKNIEPFDEQKQRLPISQKLIHAAKIVTRNRAIHYSIGYAKRQITQRFTARHRDKFN